MLHFFLESIFLPSFTQKDSNPHTATLCINPHSATGSKALSHGSQGFKSMLLHKIKFLNRHTQSPELWEQKLKLILPFEEFWFFSLKVLRCTSRHAQNYIGFDGTRYVWAAFNQFLEIRCCSAYKEKGGLLKAFTPIWVRKIQVLVRGC